MDNLDWHGAPTEENPGNGMRGRGIAMADENTATQAKIALREARRIMLGHRLTYSRIQIRLREAAIEQAEEQVLRCRRARTPWNRW
jgi:hypothetical protein